MAGALFSPSLSPAKGLRGKEQIFDSKCHSTSLQILHVLAPCCWAVMCGVSLPSSRAAPQRVKDVNHPFLTADLSSQKQEIFVHERRQGSLEKSASPSSLRTHLGFIGI